jgi:N-formylmaleamate deformylase
MRSASPPTPTVGRSRFIESDGSRLHALEYGEQGQPALVIVPGITSPAATLEFVSLELARDFHVLTMDVRGRGLSDTCTDYALADCAKDLALTISQLGLNRPAVLGHSAGARIAAAFGLLYPALRGSLVIADPPLSGPGRAPYPTPLDAFLEMIRLARSGATSDDLRPFFPSLSEEHLALRLAWLPTCDETAVTVTHRGFHEEDFFDYWPELGPPVLFLWGGASPAVSEEAAAEVAAANSAAEIVCLAQAGHMLPWDDLPGFLAAVRGFLDPTANAPDVPNRVRSGRHA